MKQAQNLTQQLTHKLGLAIVNGHYPVGEGMPSEANLCEEFEVSRSSTREAVKMLSAKGLVSSRPKQGIKVLPESSWNMFDTDVLSWILQSKPSLKLLKEFTQVRFAIEPLAAELAAKNATPIQLQHIDKALKRMADAENGLDDPLDADISFHSAILEASGNRFFLQLTQFINTALRVSIRYTNHVKGVKTADVNAHAQIYECIKSGDATGARAYVHNILEEALSLIELKL
ncbi:FadR/GntR family transcriptional regulator [Glaciecola petra]|uniref:FadR/GntR family transcriptional regulator n=1 Tax=Glaciecola petra TaxID=3075602 RepID=A0ABU2ZUY1_9ALTE|nr:FadR/GntR family transcriptional regulator [Aestuariibacter sp. P117]MDT0596066.1 FadR/GntR family transcriptional regulator [Aestuariibacter sp. P117]